MAVRNFYVYGLIDGRKTPLTGGPQSKNGGMFLKITQRDKGGIRDAALIHCWEYEGHLITTVEIDGEEIGCVQTDR